MAAHQFSTTTRADAHPAYLSRLPRAIAAICSTVLITGVVLVVATTSARAASLPFQLFLPVPVNATVNAGGPHPNSGSGAGTRNSVDLGYASGATMGVYAAAAGTVHFHQSTDGNGHVWPSCWATVDHAAGWQTQYWHLTKALTSLEGQSVQAGTELALDGFPGKNTCGVGDATHLHFSLWHGGGAVAIDGTSLGGYTPHQTGGNYCGYWTRDSSGAIVADARSACQMVPKLVNNVTTPQQTSTVDVETVPGTTAGYSLTSDGNLHPFGGASAATPSATWTWPIARSFVVLPDGTGGYVLDGWGGVHPFSVGANAMPPTATPDTYWQGWDIARELVIRSDASGGYVLDGYGGLHTFSVAGHGAPPAPTGSAYWSGWDIAHRFALNTKGTGGYVLDGYGGLHPFSTGTSAMPPNVHSTTWSGWDIARDVALGFTGRSGYTLDGYGGVHPFYADGTTSPPAATSPDYASGHDTARALALFRGTGSGVHPGGISGRYVTSDLVAPHDFHAVAAMRSIAFLPGSNTAGYTLGGNGVITAFGGAPTATPSATWTWDIAREFKILPGGKGGYVLDGWGALHPFAIGSNAAPPAAAGGPSWPGWDIARSFVFTKTGTGGYVLDGYGGLHPFAVGANAQPPTITGTAYWNGNDIARSIVLNRAGTGGYVLEGFGGLHPFAIGSNPMQPSAAGGPYWPGWDIARDVVFNTTGPGGYVLDGYGGLHPFAIGSNPKPPAVSSAYFPGWDVVSNVAMTGGGTLVTVDSEGGVHRSP
jgi:hypothetical protein